MARIALMLSTSDMSRITKISGNMDVDILTPYIYNAQRTDIKRVLTTPLYDKIINDLIERTLTGEYRIIYENFIVDMLVYYAAANFVKFGSFQITNGGIFRHLPENSTEVDGTEVDMISKRYTNLGVSVENLFYEYMKDISLPEYTVDCTKTNTFKFTWIL